ncbi:hypothetical protein ACH4LN_19370 [Streptomyces albus]|uniref:hypothetical protein n=1 Tax=Streptomyces TaxID=1883 RepID=UPI00034E5FEB|nr:MULTISPECIES: hypothetical protein [Streptomyces]EPD89484.1 hypothetical protein HMPREF1486_06426 [Streptomyces sp. HPH0547]KPC90693.1 hypothetical protein ADL27_34395 [Streptomyces sp. NRRL F-6602]QID34432.1 hypothetical protein G3260_000222 [Streptomyces albus]GHJ21431.1 hypothetical protein TPA0909_30450 [Streptomyces albus]
MTTQTDTTLLFHNTMRIADGHLEGFRAAVRRAVDFVQQHGPQLMVQTFVDEERMLAHSFQLYRDSDAVRLHWKLADPYIQEVMEHCRVEGFEVFGEPDADVTARMRAMLGDRCPLTFCPRIAGFGRFAAAPPVQSA